MLVGIFCGVFLVVVAVSVAVCAIKRRKPEKQPKKRIILLSPVRNCSDVQVSWSERWDKVSQLPLKLSWTPHAMWTLLFSFVTVCLVLYLYRRRPIMILWRIPVLTSSSLWCLRWCVFRAAETVSHLRSAHTLIMSSLWTKPGRSPLETG